MLRKRSSHVALTVPAARLEEAARYYAETMGLSRGESSPKAIEMKGENFVLWLDAGRESGPVLQEFTLPAAAAEKARERLATAGAEILGDSEHGFYLRDPFGLAYHVFLEST